MSSEAQGIAASSSHTQHIAAPSSWRTDQPMDVTLRLSDPGELDALRAFLEKRECRVQVLATDVQQVGNPFRDEHRFHSCVGEIDLWDPAAQHEENINAPKSSRGSDTEKHQLTRESFAPLGKNESAAHSGNQDAYRLSKPEVSLGSRDQLEGSTAKQRPEPGGQEI
jgi:hypothetical protein